MGVPFAHQSDPLDPTTLNDVFFRIGGTTVGKAATSLVVNSGNVLLDDIWAWRADHGTGVGWTVNTADTGLIVNGDNVTAYGLFVEHYQKYQVMWNGENGSTIMFQNEVPYDPLSQAARMHDGVNGFAAYKVADSVKTTKAGDWEATASLTWASQFRLRTPSKCQLLAGVQLHDVLTRFLNGSGGIENVVNNTGGAVSAANPGPNDVVNYR